MREATIPRAALLLGLGGLLPSLAMVAAMLALPGLRLAAATIGIAYGAVIASFIGGAWWGLAAARAEDPARTWLLALSVVPSLVAWPALLMPPATALLLLALLFATLLPTDARLQRDGVAPPWWFALRRLLSSAMALLHGAAAAILILRGAGLPG